MEEIRMLYALPGEEPRIINADGNDYKQLQKLVGGYFEEHYFGNGVYMILNEVGKLTKMPVNFIMPPDAPFFDVIVGPAVFAGIDGEEHCSLTDEQIKYICERIR